MTRLFALTAIACVATTANAQILWESPDPFGTEEQGAVGNNPGLETGGGLIGIGVVDPLGDVDRNIVGELYFPGGQRFLNINSGFGGGTPTFDLMPTDIGRTAKLSFDYYIDPVNTSLDNDGLDGEGNPISPDLFWVQLNYNNKNVEDNSFGFINSLSELENPGDWNTLTFEMLIPDMVIPRNGDPAEVPTIIGPQIVFADGGFGSGTPNGSLTPAMFIDNILLEIVDTVVDNFPGDANGDGTVDLLDLDILGANFGTTGTGTFETGDFNGDGNVDLLDLDILGGNFGNSAGGSAAIPEPTALGLLTLAAMGLVARRR